MGWRQALRAIEADQRRSERAALRQHRQLQREYIQLEKHAEKVRAANEVAQFENYLELIVSLHKDSGITWDWSVLASAPSPKVPDVTAEREALATTAVANYAPGFFERLFGKEKKVRANLERSLSDARAADTEENQRRVGLHRDATVLWERRRQIGSAVVAQLPSGYREALEHIEPFQELTTFGARVTISATEATVVALNCEMVDKELVPTEELKLTAGGKVSTKEMAAGKYWPLHQDFLCSAAIRLARETFAALPVPRVIVNIGRTQTNLSTGHPELVCLLAVHFVREKLASLNLESIDPSDSLKNFSVRMKFKKTAGFEPVEPITVEEQWVTTG